MASEASIANGSGAGAGPTAKFRLARASTPQGAAEELSEAGSDVVGSNCGIAIEQMIEIIAAMRTATKKPIITHVNAGMPRIEGGKIIYPHTPQHMAPLYTKLVDAGANIVGGCCGTGPAHIRAIVKALKG